jgi:hypothetical protein
MPFCGSLVLAPVLQWGLSADIIWVPTGLYLVRMASASLKKVWHKINHMVKGMGHHAIIAYR